MNVDFNKFKKTIDAGVLPRDGMKCEYIEREAFLEHMKKKTNRYFDVKFDIEEFPAAEVVPVVHGKWIYEEIKGGPPIWRCSRCGRGMNSNPEGIDLYCYHCGAKMDEKK